MGGENTDKPAYLVGIDFGACNIKVVSLLGNRFKALKINTDQQGGKECPNYLRYMALKDGGIDRVLGRSAKRNAPGDPYNIVGGIKRKLEEQAWEAYVPVLERKMNAIEVATDIFTQLRKNIPAAAGQSVEAVLTAPVAFSNMQILRLRKAAEAAGFKVKAVLGESFAAMFALDRLDELEEGLHVIFDFGGSTLDVSVFEILRNDQGLKITELAASGLRLGGLDIDNAIYEMFGEEERNALNQTYKKYDPETVRKNLLLDVEGWKEDLFNSCDEVINIMPEPDINLSRDAVYAFLAGDSIRGRVIAMLDQLFEELEEGRVSYGKEDVIRVWPFGGTCRIPYFTRLLEEYFTPDVFCADHFNPDDNEAYIKGIEDNYMCVAAGAARYLQLRDDPAVAITSSLPFSVGIMQDGVFMGCLEKNSMAGYESPLRLLPLDWLEKKGWRVPIYQVFKTGDMREPIYMGQIKLDKSLYEDGEFPGLVMRMTPFGDLEVRIFQRQLCDNEYDINLIQEFRLIKGCGDEPE